MTRWKIDAKEFIVRDFDYTAGFDCTNVENKRTVHVTFTQVQGHPASDLVGALRAVAALLVKVQEDATAEAAGTPPAPDASGDTPPRLH